MNQSGTRGGLAPTKDIPNYDPPKGPKWDNPDGPGLHGTNHGNCGTQTPNSPQTRIPPGEKGPYR